MKNILNFACDFVSEKFIITSETTKILGDNRLRSSINWKIQISYCEIIHPLWNLIRPVAILAELIPKFRECVIKKMVRLDR